MTNKRGEEIERERGRKIEGEKQIEREIQRERKALRDRKRFTHKIFAAKYVY